ncbi:MAG: single-stranded-DNA-specific exonuclease RecJ [Clostridia bacterium]|nr:single-stranded-DNA-specific exonuclease RecJ [Clostridia bacterium]
MLRFVQRSGERSWFERPEGMSPVLHQLLIQRGISSAEEAEVFLHPGMDQLNDPFLLSDMDTAAARIRRAIDADEPICVWGDYDVDGVSASAILYDYLTSEGAKVEVYLPSRHDEGYGLNESGLREIAQRASLLVTVDCGISSHDLIELAKELGLDCIVTDHHRPGEVLPECPVVNPLLNDYPFPYLCGAGVAFKLVHALAGLDAAMERIDLAAIATVADVVSLTGENRAIVHLGLQKINNAPRPGVAALMESARIEPGQADSQGVAFRIAPRLNAGGRLGSAWRSFNLLVQEEPFLAIAQADELEQENARRQSIEREIRAQAEEQLSDFDFSAHRILLVRGEGWNSGVIGLTASHLKEKYHYPVIALAEEDGMLVGSCRSIEGVDIFKTLSSAAELMEKFGGHSQAAGLTVKAENFEALWTALDEYLFENIPPETYMPSAAYDISASLDEFSEAFVRAMGALEPTGCGNPEPIFRTTVKLIEARAIGAQGSHLRLLCAENGARRTGIYFGAGELAGGLGEEAEILFTPQLNSWNGRVDVQLRLCALREMNTSARIDAANGREGLLLRRFLTELFYNRRISCTRSAVILTMQELKFRLEGNMQGTWILCAGLQDAKRIAAAMEPCPLDLSIGELPGDARAFNTLVVCPDRLDTYPKGLRTLVLAGLPVPDELPDGVKVYSLEGCSFPAGELPDVNQMREVYKAARNLSRRPVKIGDMEALVQILSEEVDLPPTCCHASLLALMDLKLVEVTTKPVRLLVPAAQKTDPQSSALWRGMQKLREESEGRELG